MLYLDKRNILWPSQWFREGGTGEYGHLFQGNKGTKEPRNQSLKVMRTGDQRQFGGTRNITNQDFDFLGTRENVDFFFQGNKGTPSNPPPHAPAERASIILPGKDQESS